MSPESNEDLIEATIRRVAEAKAAREAAANDAPSPAEAAASTATDAPADDAPADVVPAGAPVASSSEPADAHPTPEAAAVRAADEDLIEATIRRVAAARAANEAAAVAPPPDDDAPAPTPISAAPRPVAHAAKTPAHDGRAELLALRQEVSAMQGMIAELEARVTTALAATRDGSAPPADDDWDDAPVLPRMAIGAMPRPPVLRDPPTRGALAEALVAEPEPAPAPAPPPKGGFDLLPRTYRVTVEDKRRGVDLVPLHRALLAMDGVRDMSLLSYSNGVAIVSVDMVHPLEPEVLREAVAGAMLRGARVESHNETTMVVKLAEE